MKTLKENVRVQIEYPEGYEFVRYGRPTKGELVLSECGGVYKAPRFSSFPGKHFILKRIE